MSEEIKQFFIQNWQLLASAVLFIIATVIGIVTKRKKGYTFSDILLGLIAEQLPQWISISETTGGTGEQKKVAVLNSALNYASKTLGRKLSEEETSFIIAQASEQIEKILGTPQKKEAEKLLEVKKNGAKYR